MTTYAIEMLEAWLRAGGFDGLVNDDGGCSCDFDNFVHCDGDVGSCVGGTKVPCLCGDNCDWHMAPGRVDEKDYR